MKKLTPVQFESAMHKAAGSLRDTTAPMQKAVLIAETASKQEASSGPNKAVKTGAWRRSITGRVLTAQRGVVGSNLSYAPYVHEGTKHMRARPAIRDGIKKATPRIVEVFAGHAQKALDEVGK